MAWPGRSACEWESAGACSQAGTPAHALHTARHAACAPPLAQSRRAAPWAPPAGLTGHSVSLWPHRLTASLREISPYWHTCGPAREREKKGWVGHSAAHVWARWGSGIDHGRVHAARARWAGQAWREKTSSGPSPPWCVAWRGWGHWTRIQPQAQWCTCLQGRGSAQGGMNMAKPQIVSGRTGGRQTGVHRRAARRMHARCIGSSQITAARSGAPPPQAARRH